MRYFEVEGDSPNEILTQFIAQQGISKDYVEMEIIEAGSKGILGIGKKPAKVKIQFDDKEFNKKKAKLYLSEILEKAGFDYHIEISENKGDVLLNILSEDSSVLIGKSATMLDSFQYLLDRLIRTDDSSDFRLLVDVDSYRERVIEPLKEKAIKLAVGVKKTGKPAKMAPMATLVRREIHMAAKSIPGVSTISHGDGQVKALTIFIDKKGKDGEEGRKYEKNSNFKNNRNYRPKKSGE